VIGILQALAQKGLLAAAGGTFWLPEAKSTFAQNVDSTFYFIYWLCVFFFLLILAMALVFLVKYRRKGEEPKPKVYAATIAYNAVPLCETFLDDGYSTEEVKLLHETRKIMGETHSGGDVDVSMTCVRVPVPVGHAATMLIETEKPLSPEEARSALAAFPGVEVVDDPSKNQFPTPRDVEGRDEVLVGRVRRDLGSDRIALWQVSDNLRKGAATNAVQIAEGMLERGLLPA